MNALYRQRSAFEKQLLAELTRQIKRSRWKKSKCALFLQTDGLYQDIFVNVHHNAAVTVAELRFKPMTLDPILWDILDTPENHHQPLSFRTWGAFTCSALPIFEVQMEQPGDTAAVIANKLAILGDEKAHVAGQALLNKAFSELVAAHPRQVERGAYAVTLVTSLIAEKNIPLAYDMARSYASGQRSSVATITSHDKSFHQLAVEWLDAGRQSAHALRNQSGA